MTRLNPYISFKDDAREAMEFYKSVFGGILDMTTFKEGGVPGDPEQDDKIMHARLVTGGGMVFMAADTPKGMKYDSGKNVSMSLSGEDEAELTGFWKKLAVGADIEQPLEKAHWGDKFGMLTDKFGVRWMVDVVAKKT
jgi:PhnB protein